MVSAPKPGRTVRGSTTGRPVMAALDMFGRRWALRIVWELSRGPLGFRALQQSCDGMSSSVMRVRLTELQQARLVRRRADGGYLLTELGEGAYAALRPLIGWSDEWATALGSLAPLPAEDHVCDSCAMRYADTSVPAALAIVREAPDGYSAALVGIDRDGLRRRADDLTWSALEYACHVRDVCEVYGDRVQRTRTEESPVLEPMYNDERARRERYNEQDLGDVLDDLARNARRFAALGPSITVEQWSRTATRLAGEERTLRWLVRQVAHECRHHLYDIRRVLAGAADPVKGTVR